MKTMSLRACRARRSPLPLWSAGSVLFSMLALLAIALPAVADTFGSGANQFTIDFVTIGDPGNLPDANPNPAGAVQYAYRIGKYEIPEDAINKADAIGNLGIAIDSRGPNKPATSVTWYEAAEFVNWLNTSTGHSPAYKFDSGGSFQLWLPTDTGYDTTNLYRNKLAKYFLPSLNEWHKAAYYDPVAGHYWDYPTGSDSIPDGIDFPGDPNFDGVFYDGGLNSGPNDITDVGLLSPYGTVGIRAAMSPNGRKPHLIEQIVIQRRAGTMLVEAGELFIPV
jgi:formylglycine-generating enzyme